MKSGRDAPVFAHSASDGLQIPFRHPAAADTKTGSAFEPTITDRHLSHIAHLTLQDFRSYSSLSLSVGAEPVVLTGPNGAGKTNILEAISLFAPGRGLRRAKLSDMTRWPGAVESGEVSQGAFKIGSTINSALGPVTIGTGLSMVAEGDRSTEPDDEAESLDQQSSTAVQRRIVRIDGAPASGPSDFQSVLKVIWLTPAMDRLFTEGAASRRRFLDQLIFSLDLDHARRVGAYERSMRERARLLRADGKADPAWLSALEAQMAEQGVAVAAARNDAISLLQAAIEESVTEFPSALLQVSGDLENDLTTMSALEAEDAYRLRLEGLRRRDAELGQTTAGPHRSDLEVRHLKNGVLAKETSTGQQKALLVGIILANARLLASLHGSSAIVLLDEIAAHLDETRRNALFDEIADLKVQAWMTGTDAASFEGLHGRMQHFDVTDSTLNRNT